MAIFRVSKNRNYTVMSNYHLKDRALTLKSKGLLSMMLSLPEEWDYTTRGLASICKEGVDAIGASLKELEAGGSCGTAGAGSPIPSTRSMSVRIRPNRIRLYHIRKTRIWIPRIRFRRVRKSPQN